MHVIVGLGNPGREYRETRHNTGFMALEKISQRTGIRVSEFKFQGRMGAGKFQGHSLLLLKPRTYMNLSGKSVRACLAYYRLSPQSLIVIHDDLDLPLGRLRLRPKGGDGGHRGLRSIIDELGTQEFVRVRVGIGRPGEDEDPVDYVLTPFSAAEREIMEPALEAAALACLAIITDGLERAMNRFNSAGGTKRNQTAQP